MHKADQAVAVQRDIMCRLLCLLFRAKDFPGVGKEDLSFFCQDQGTAFAAEQRKSQLLFQLPDCLGE